jgi:hypothetical protein
MRSVEKPTGLSAFLVVICLFFSSVHFPMLGRKAGFRACNLTNKQGLHTIFSTNEPPAPSSGGTPGKPSFSRALMETLSFVKDWITLPPGVHLCVSRQLQGTCSEP